MYIMKRKWTLSIIEEEPGDGASHEFKCAQSGMNLNIAVWEALQAIRSRLKYGQDVSEEEEKTLTDIRSLLAEAYIEEN